MNDSMNYQKLVNALSSIIWKRDVDGSFKEPQFSEILKSFDQ